MSPVLTTLGFGPGQPKKLLETAAAGFLCWMCHVYTIYHMLYSYELYKTNVEDKHRN